MDYARQHPARVVELAFIKLWRFWKPWPSAEEAATGRPKAVIALFSLVLFAGAAYGLWLSRRRWIGVGFDLGAGAVFFRLAHDLCVIFEIPSAGGISDGRLGRRRLAGDLEPPVRPSAPNRGPAMHRREMLWKSLKWFGGILLAAGIGGGGYGYWMWTHCDEFLLKILHPKANRTRPGLGHANRPGPFRLVPPNPCLRCEAQSPGAERHDRHAARSGDCHRSRKVSTATRRSRLNPSRSSIRWWN